MITNKKKLLFLLFCFFIFFIYNNIIYYEFFGDNNYQPSPIVHNFPDSKDIILKLKNDVSNVISLSISEFDNNNTFFNLPDIPSDRHNILYNCLLKINLKINDVDIKEIIPSDDDISNNITSYTVNKGEQMFLCFRDPHTNKKGNYNTLLYVVLHEFTHIGCDDIGHSELFKELNKYVVILACHLKIYKYKRFNGEKYCSTELYNNIIDDTKIVKFI